MFARTIRLILVVLATGLTVTLAACGEEDDGEPSGAAATPSGQESEIPETPESGTFSMAIQPWIGYGPWYIAEEEGAFEETGVDVKFTNFTTDDQLNSAFASGRLQGANVATHTALKLAAAGLPIKIVLLEDVSTTADAILAGDGIDSVADLRGKRVAYEEGSTSDILLRYALQENGMSLDDVKKVPIPAADAGAAALAGRVDAAVTYEPYLTTALNEDDKFKLIYSAEEKPGLISDVFIVSEETLDSRPGQVRALVASWGQAISAYRADPPRGQTIIAEGVGAKPAELKTAFDGVEFYDVEENRAQLAGDYRSETIGDVLEVAKQAGLVEGDVNPDDLLTPEFVEAAAQG